MFRYYEAPESASANQPALISAFTSFVKENTDALVEIIASHRVQSNEVRRCSALLPMLFSVSSYTSLPLYMIDIGCSAGLMLNWDKYFYKYIGQGEVGSCDSQAKLVTECRGKSRAPLKADFPQVAHRLGIELTPIDLSDEDSVDWLKALIWPEQTERLELLQDAVETFRQNPHEILAGDANDLLPSILENAPQDDAICVYHSQSVYQFTKEARQRLHEILSDASSSREIYRVAMEPGQENFNVAMLMLYQ